MSAADLAALHAACFTTPRPWSEAEISVLLAEPGTHLSLIPVAGNLHGFALGRVTLDEAELLTIAVDPAARGRGLGRQLLGDLLARLAAGGATSVFLEVAEDNAPARALYAATGFAPVGRRRGYYHHPDGRAVDALVLRRPLAKAARDI